MNNILEKLNWSLARRVPIILQSEISECGLACINMIMNYYGNNISLLSLRNMFRLSSRGLDLEKLQKILESFKFESRALSLELEELNYLQIPCILHWDFDHFVVLTKVTNKYIYINDPAYGRKKIKKGESSKHFTGIALEIWPSTNFNSQKKESINISLKDVLKNLREIKSPILKILSLSLVIETVTLFLPFGSQIILDNVISSSDLSLLIIICSILLFSDIFKFVLIITRQLISIKMNTIISVQWKVSFFTRLLKIPLDFFEKRHLGDIKSRFDSLDNIYSTITSSIKTFTINMVVLIYVVVMMFIYSRYLFLIVSIFLLVYILIRMMTYIKFKQINKELIYKKAKTDSHFMESLYGIQTIKSLNLNSIRKEYWLSLFINSINISVQNQKYSSFFEAVEGITAAVNEITILGIGVYMVMDNTLTLGMFIAFNVYRSIFIENISAFINDFVALRMLSIHYDRISDIALTNIEKNNDIPLFSCNFSEKSNNQEIILKIENITYGYDHLSDPILNKISLSIRKNDIVAIVGPSGCGKTTLIKIMSGLLYPNQGNVIYNGTNIKQMGYPNYRDNIALVLQEDHLFSGSLLMNIACFDKNIDMDWVVECAHVANIHDDIINMPMGYGTIIGELGQGLSGGQKQRILLARSLYKKPKILFLDESTSHLDVKNEAIINANIMNLDITRVVVAHRESTINYAKNIIDLSNYR